MKKWTVTTSLYSQNRKTVPVKARNREPSAPTNPTFSSHDSSLGGNLQNSFPVLLRTIFSRQNWLPFWRSGSHIVLQNEIETAVHVEASDRRVAKPAEMSKASVDKDCFFRRIKRLYEDWKVSSILLWKGTHIL